MQIRSTCLKARQGYRLGSVLVGSLSSLLSRLASASRSHSSENRKWLGSGSGMTAVLNDTITTSSFSAFQHKQLSLVHVESRMHSSRPNIMGFGTRAKQSSSRVAVVS